MLENIVGTIVGVILSAGGLSVIVHFFGQKIMTLLYDTIREKISLDMEKKKAEFENVLEQRLKILESKLERSSHAALSQYDIEVKNYDEISQKLYTCFLSIKNLYNIPLMEDEKAQVQGMREIRRQVLDNANALEKAYEEGAPFIRKEIYDIIVTYTQHVSDLEKILCQNAYGVRQVSNDDVQTAKHLMNEIHIKKQSIQNSIRSRLEELGRVIEE